MYYSLRTEPIIYRGVAALSCFIKTWNELTSKIEKKIQGKLVMNSTSLGDGTVRTNPLLKCNRPLNGEKVRDHFD